MLARCPACQTVFRVSPEQLAARQGRVRCGHCLNAFNAVHNAVEEGQRPEAAPVLAEPANPSASEPERESPGAEAPPADETPAPADEPVGIVVDEDATEQAPDNTAASVTPGALPAVLHTRSDPIGGVCPVRLLDEWDAAETPDSALVPTSEATRVTAPHQDAADAEPLQGEGSIAAGTVASAILTRSSVGEDHEGPPGGATAEVPLRFAPSVGPDALRRRLGIALGCLVATLLVQGLFLFRQPLSQAIPALRPSLAALCDRLGCALPLPQEAEQISIETSDLHPEPGGKGDFVLHATLRNRARFPQAYPYVELSLTDAADKALVRRVFSPEEWAPGTRLEDGFAPGGTAEVALPFNAGGVAALGYRVYAFYP
jgi:predicted Zn finger-like uncharacterized protein